MATAITDTHSGERAPKADGGEKSPTRGRRVHAESDQESNEHARYFLGKTDSNGGPPALDREVSSEGEALVEALRSGVTYYALQEFRVVPDFSGRRPQLKKELVQGK